MNGSRLEVLLLLFNGRFQFLHLVVFFQELVEQHRIHRVRHRGNGETSERERNEDGLPD